MPAARACATASSARRRAVTALQGRPARAGRTTARPSRSRVTPASRSRSNSSTLGRLGVALHGDLGAVGDVELRQGALHQPGEVVGRQQRRRAAPDEDAGQRGPGARRPPCPGGRVGGGPAATCVGRGPPAGRDVAVHDVSDRAALGARGVGRPRREVAVPTAVGAERHVEVEPEPRTGARLDRVVPPARLVHVPHGTTSAGPARSGPAQLQPGGVARRARRQPPGRAPVPRRPSTSGSRPRTGTPGSRSAPPSSYTSCATVAPRSRSRTSKVMWTGPALPL